MVSAKELARFSSLFVSRCDAYAVQLPDGSYTLVRAPVTQHTIVEHLRGKHTMGAYVIDEWGECRYAVFDADTADGWAALLEVQAKLANDDIPSYLERSRRGGHLWVFFARPISAATARWWLLPYCPAGMEFFPKQDRVERYGSLIRVPLGLHRLTGQRYPFVFWRRGQLVPVVATLNEMLTWLTRVERAGVPAFDIRDVERSRQRTGAATQEKSKGSHVTVVHPETLYGNIAQWCAAQDPLRVIGRYVRLNQSGVGHCPFGEHHEGGRDDHPSFRVFQPERPGGSCWYCYASGRGGDVFNFLTQYHHLDTRTLWARIQAGEQF